MLMIYGFRHKETLFCGSLIIRQHFFFVLKKFSQFHFVPSNELISIVFNSGSYISKVCVRRVRKVSKTGSISVIYFLGCYTLPAQH